MIALCPEGPIFRWSYVQRVLCSENICSEGSMFRWSHIQKILCSESPMFRNICSEGPICSEDPIFRNMCLEGSISRRSYVQKVLYSEGPLFRRSYAGIHFYLSASGIKTSRVSFLFPSKLYYSLLGIHASEFQSYDIFGTSNSEIPQVRNLEAPNPSSEVLSSCVAFFAVFFVIY